MNHKDLWKFIREEVGNYYEIESKEILIFCKLSCMSLPPFLAALEYHTGIKLNWGKVKESPNENNKFDPDNINIKSQLNSKNCKTFDCSENWLSNQQKLIIILV